MRSPSRTWKSEVRELIEQKWKPSEAFTFIQVYEFEAYFKGLHPSNFNVRDKLYQILQQLRDDKFLTFIDYNGTYRRISK